MTVPTGSLAPRGKKVSLAASWEHQTTSPSILVLPSHAALCEGGLLFPLLLVAEKVKGSGSEGSGASLPTQSVCPISHIQVAAVPSAQFKTEELTVPQSEAMDTGTAAIPPKSKRRCGCL